MLGIGRGDSALAFVGHAPAYVRVLDSYLKALQAYLKGSSVAFDDLTYSRGMAPPVGTLNLAESPADSRLRWLDARDKKVPVAVAASGPKVIATAARHAPAHHGGANKHTRRSVFLRCSHWARPWMQTRMSRSGVRNCWCVKCCRLFRGEVQRQPAFHHR